MDTPSPTRDPHPYVRSPGAEGLTRIDPVAAGRLLGLDRAPEVKTLRRRMAALAGMGRADRLLGGLAARHAAAHDQAMGVLYVDGHVRAYHGQADVPKAHVARIRLSMPAEVDTWVADANGDGLLVWTAPPGASLVGELRRVDTEVRTLVGPDRRPTIAFDRGGWSPKLFVELAAAGFDILTYRKEPCVPEPRSAFTGWEFTDDRGHTQTYWLADRNVRIPYKDNGADRYFACRQLTRLDRHTGHQTQIVTTRTDAVGDTDSGRCGIARELNILGWDNLLVTAGSCRSVGLRVGGSRSWRADQRRSG